MLKLDPNWITGFVDGEGCFHVRFSKRKRLNVGIEIGLSFSISQRSSDMLILKSIRDYFGCGGLKFNRKDGCYVYEVRDLACLGKIILHFKNYPLKTVKLESYNIFCDIYKKVKSKEHLSVKGAIYIIEKAYDMNPSGKRRIKKEDLLKLIPVKDIV